MTTDWVTLSAGIILLGLLVVFSVMNNSAGYLMSEFDDLNQRFAEDGEALALETSGRDGEAAAAAANASTALKAASGLENAVSVTSQNSASGNAVETLNNNLNNR